MNRKLASAMMAAVISCAQPVPLKVVATDMAFSPREMHVAAQPLHIEFKNEGSMLHDWNVAFKDQPAHTEAHSHSTSGAASMHVMANPGQTARADFGPLEAGVYEFYCSVPGHREAGMKGRLIVHE